MLSPDGTPQLADFGISIPMISDERQLGRVLHGGSADEDRVPDVLRSKTLEGTPLYLVRIEEVRAPATSIWEERKCTPIHQAHTPAEAKHA